jgi:acetyl esterase
MPIDSRLQPFLDVIATSPSAATGELSVAERRLIAGRQFPHDPDRPEVASVQDHSVAVADGKITVRVYRPAASAPVPAHLYLHGGGFWLGDLDQVDASCRRLVTNVGCVVASVDYRLAPEVRFPVPPEDCYAALCWLVERAGHFGVDPARVSVGGGSAGGNLAAVTAMMARDRGGPALVLQVLELPVIDLTLSFPSVVENGEGYLLTRQGMEQYIGYYLADPSEAKEPYASPIFATDLAGLPPALIMTAAYDPLRDEGEAYGERLREAGVSADIRRWEGQFHGSQNLIDLIPDKVEAYRAVLYQAYRDAYR